MSLEKFNGDGFKKHVEEEKKFEGKLEIRDLLIELDSIMPWRFKAVGIETDSNTKEINMDSEITKVDFSVFMDDPERVAWLRDFVFTSKEKMKEVLPAGLDLGVLNGANFFYARESGSINNEQAELIFKNAREIRDEYINKINTFIKVE